MAMYSKVGSRYKMVCLLAHGNDYLKQNGKTPVFHIAIRYNKRPIDFIVKYMERMYGNTDVYRASNIIRFYDKYTDTIVHQINQNT